MFPWGALFSSKSRERGIADSIGAIYFSHISRVSPDIFVASFGITSKLTVSASEISAGRVSESTTRLMLNISGSGFSSGTLSEEEEGSPVSETEGEVSEGEAGVFPQPEKTRISASKTRKNFFKKPPLFKIYTLIKV